MKKGSAKERIEAVKITLEAFGYNFNSITVTEAFILFDEIQGKINNSLKECSYSTIL
jgi:hypothetical protein